MIIWGLRKKEVVRELPYTMACPQCSGKEYSLSGFLRYLHIFWIPLFTVQKQIFASCNSCDHVMDKKSLSKSLTKEIKGLIFSTKHHVLYNFGILTVSILVILFAIMVLSMMPGSSY